MTELLWKNPLTITSDEGPYIVDGPSSAMDFLEHKWTGDCGPLCQAAIVACKAAMEPGGDIGEARRAFSLAAIEANNPVLAP